MMERQDSDFVRPDMARDFSFGGAVADITNTSTGAAPGPFLLGAAHQMAIFKPYDTQAFRVLLMLPMIVSPRALSWPRGHRLAQCGHALP